MADTRRKTILLLGDAITKFKTSTAAAIKPGHLIETITGGTVRVHATAGGNARPMFAMEDEGQGKTITDAYSNSTLIRCLIPQRGAEVLARLKNGQSVVAGDFLESGGGGELQKHVADVDTNLAGASSNGPDFTVYTNQIIAVAAEACDMSGSDLADPTGLFAVEII